VRLTPRREAGLSILDAIQDERLFRPWFKNKASWKAWMVFLSALFASPMTAEQLETYRECTGRTEAPDEIAKEGWLICGRRAGKSFILAVIAVYLACFKDYRRYLQPGERGTVSVIAADRKQARVILRYVMGLLKGVAMLNRMIERETAESVDLSNSVTIEVHTASFRSTRGFTLVAALLDEAAFWRSEDSSNPDSEILNAIRPAMATIPTSMLLVASSPYARRGIIWNAHRKFFGKPGPVLVWQAATRTMNPSVPQSFLDQAYEDDPIAAAAEYGAQFRSDVEAFIAREIVEQCMEGGVHERPAQRGITYSCFVDCAGGSGQDSFCLAIGHKEKGTEGAILDAIRERKPPFSPEAVVAEYAQLLKSYRITKVIGDRFGGEWPREVFQRHGISYEPSAKPKSELYSAFLPLLNSHRADLLDNERMLHQIVGLERRTARGGRDTIDHAPGGHDDVANVVAGVLTNLVHSKYRYTLDYIDATDEERKRNPAVNRLAALSEFMGARFW
jgi:hypothetical protein